mmetsp:Transcript_4868/g.8480  ORF Transcript_4868/g.8480 Transcript_4868/m.8480 type:complete len:106 (-) Transcript_4868:1504-1821(-)
MQQYNSKSSINGYEKQASGPTLRRRFLFLTSVCIAFALVMWLLIMEDSTAFHTGEQTVIRTSGKIIDSISRKTLRQHPPSMATKSELDLGAKKKFDHAFELMEAS